MSEKGKILRKAERAIRAALKTDPEHDGGYCASFKLQSKAEHAFIPYLESFLDRRPSIQRGKIVTWVDCAYYDFYIVRFIQECETCGTYLCSGSHK